MHPPSISVIVPVFNGAEYLKEAIDSVFAQQYSPLEVIVVDDGSTDDSALIATSYASVQVLQKTHSGLASTLNHGIRHASGDLLAFLDADDRWLPRKLALQTSALIDNTDFDMVFGQCNQFRVKTAGDAQFREVMSGRQQGVAKSGLLIWRRAFMRIGLFAEEDTKHEFLDWYSRSLDAGLLSLLLDDILFERRIHDRNLGRTFRSGQRTSYLRTLHDSIVRRRRQETSAP